MTLTVLMSVPRPKPTTNPYIALLGRAVEGAGAAVEFFTWRAALFGTYDLFHAHWPENLLRAGNPLKRLAKIILFVLFLVSLSLRRRVVVQTVHNLDPHERLGRLDRFLLRRLDRRVRVRILLNDAVSSPTEPSSATVTVPHGDYRVWFTDLPRCRRVPGTMSFVGLIKPYKGVESLIAAFAELDRADLRLQISGMPASPELRHELTAAASHHGVSLDLTFQSDAQLVAVVTSSELIVLPYAEMYNSGAALLALSLDRPVLVPDNQVTRALAEEIGETWVLRYEQPLTAAALDAAHRAASTIPAGSTPDLSKRSWSSAGREHVKAYTLAITLRRSR